MTSLLVKMTDGSLAGVGIDPVTGEYTWDWSETNRPNAFSNQSQLTADWDGTEVVAPLTDGAPYELWDRMTDTIARVNGTGRVIIEYPDQKNYLTSFRKAVPTGTDPTYAYGWWDNTRRFRGFLGQGESSIIEMAANSTTQVQLDKIATMTAGSSGQTLQMSMMRIEGTPASPYRVSGMTFQAADQPNLTASAVSGIYLPQPSPHNGILFYSDTSLAGSCSYSRFLAAGRAINSMPPGEAANMHSGRGYQKWHHLDIDGRRAASIDPARPRRCGAFLINSEYDHLIEDSWIHHTNVSRYAANDQNSDAISGKYYSRRIKMEEITTNRNSDPALNGGNTLGGFTNASLMGWETTNAELRVENSILSVDNPYTDGQFAAHHQLTHVGAGAQKRGGRAYFIDNTYRHTKFPQLDGYCILRVSDTTYWWLDGFNNTIFVSNNGVRKIPVVHPKGSLSWPPTQAWLNSQGASPLTHYIIRAA